PCFLVSPMSTSTACPSDVNTTTPSPCPTSKITILSPQLFPSTGVRFCAHSTHGRSVAITIRENVFIGAFSIPASSTRELSADLHSKIPHIYLLPSKHSNLS